MKGIFNDHPEEHKTTMVQTPGGIFVKIETDFIDVNGWYSDRGQCQYESMVFRCDKYGHIRKFKDLDARKYRTWEEALCGHEELVLRWKGEY